MTAFNHTITFNNNGEALAYFSALRLVKVRALPATFAGVNYGDDGEKIDVVAVKSGPNKYDVTERAR